MEYVDNATIEIRNDGPDKVCWTNHVELGRFGEECAARHLMDCGLDIVARNWKCPAGEVDIVAKGERSLRFVEVKTRQSTGKGFPEEAVDADKRRRYERIAEYFLRDHRCSSMSVHFDVIAIIFTSTEQAFMKVHLNAFTQG